MEEIRIQEIIKVEFDNSIMELHFNLSSNTSLSILLTYDGETIEFISNDDWIDISSIKYDLFLTSQIQKKDELYCLIDNSIKKIELGVECNSVNDIQTLFYFKLTTNLKHFLFFNNGDMGDYTFNPDYILKDSIYIYEWKNYRFG